MTALLSIAFRNLLRARRRNLLSGGTMALGTAALVLGGGLSDGIARQLTASLVAVQTGHLQVVVRAADFEPQNSPFDAYGQALLPGAEALARRLAAEVPGVARAVPFLYGRGTVIAGNRSTLASVVGILPAEEPELRAAHPAVRGAFLPGDDALATYVAEPVARKLRLTVGDSVSFVMQTPQGAVNSIDAVVCGVFRKGAPWYDSTFYVPLAAAQTLFDRPGAATNIKMTLADGSSASARRTRPAVAALVGAPRGAGAGRARAGGDLRGGGPLLLLHHPGQRDRAGRPVRVPVHGRRGGDRELDAHERARAHPRDRHRARAGDAAGDGGAAVRAGGAGPGRGGRHHRDRPRGRGASCITARTGSPWTP